MAWLGRQGSRALAISLLIAVGLPPLGRALRPWLTEAVFLLLVLSFLRLDMARLGAHLRRPRLVLAATLWTATGVPLLVWAPARLAGLAEWAPGLNTGLMLQALASPLMAGPGLAALMGLDATLVLIALVCGTAVLPLVVWGLAPVLLAPVLSGGALAVGPGALALRLGLLVGGAAGAALLLRRLVGEKRILRQREALDGANVLILGVFICAVTGDLAGAFGADPAGFVAILGLAFAVAAALFLATVLIFLRAGRREALSLGIMAAQRNMGLMFAAAAGGLPAGAWLYFALSQFPIYLSPLLLRPVVRWYANNS